MQIGAFVFNWGCDTYGTDFRGTGGGRKERSGERSSRRRKSPQTVSESQIRRDFTSVDSQSGSTTSYAKSCICELNSTETG